MRIFQLQEVSDIDSEIVELHEKLQALYSQRAELLGAKQSTAGGSLQSLSDSIDLSGIDLSLK